MINVFLFVAFDLMLFMIMKSDINKLVCILFVHLSSISLENFKDRALIIPKILEFIKLHTYKYGLVYLAPNVTHPMARSTSVSKIDSWNVKLRFGDESKMEGEYVVMLGIIHTCTALGYKPAFIATW